jgi:hypothetical protein
MSRPVEGRLLVAGLDWMNNPTQTRKSYESKGEFIGGGAPEGSCGYVLARLVRHLRTPGSVLRRVRRVASGAVRQAGRPSGHGLVRPGASR